MLIHRPWQYTQSLFSGLPALCLAVAGAVRARPHQRHMPSSYIFLQVCLKDILCQMQGVRVVHLVHQDCIRVVVDCYVHLPPQCHLYANGCPAPSGKAVNYHPISHISHTITSGKSNRLICTGRFCSSFIFCSRICSSSSILSSPSHLSAWIRSRLYSSRL